MKLILIAISLFSIVNCASHPAAEESAKTIFFTDMNGPNRESGDCGGYAFWLREDESGQFRSGEMAVFEGGCTIHRFPMTEVKHDPKTKTIQFYSETPDTAQLMKFTGKVNTAALYGRVFTADKFTKEALNEQLPAKRMFKKADFKSFLEKLPQSKK